MPVRDRLPELKAAQLNKKDKSSVVLISDENNGLDSFLDEVQQIKDIIDKFQQCVNQTKKIQNSILFAQRVDLKMNESLDDSMAETKRTLIKAKDRIQALQTKTNQIHGTESENRIRKTQHSMLFKLFADVMNDYNETQLQFRENCKTRIRRQFEIIGKETNDEELEQFLEGANGEVFIQGLINETQSAKQSLAEINARHKDIIKIEKSISELCDMFRELELHVENQGELIDRIEFQVLDSKNSAEKGNKEINEALRSQSKSRKRKIIIISVFVLVLALILIVLIIQF